MGYSIPSFVRFEQLLDPMKKPYFQNSSFANFKKFRHKSNFSSKTLILTKSFADSELVRPVCLRFVPKTEKKQNLMKTLRLVRKILASYTTNCNFQHNSNFSSKTLFLTNSFADSELVRRVCLRFVLKIEKKQKK